VEVEHECLRKTRVDFLNPKLTISFQENTLASKEKELVNKEKRMAEKQLQELAATRRMMEELQAARAVEAWKISYFLIQTETALAPLSFSLLRSGEPVREVSTVLPLLDFMGAKMLSLEEVVCEQLEVEGRVLAEKVAEQVLTCFQSWDLNASLEPVVQRPIIEVEEAARASIQDTAKLMVARFQCQLNNAYGSRSSFVIARASCIL
jgi:hypothetical protein